MIKISHKKIKNTGLLFEVLTKKLTSETLSGKKSNIVNIIQKYFYNTELGKEYKLYEVLSNHQNITDSKANIVIESILKAYDKLDHSKIKNEKFIVTK